jgi:hypothetical protein
MRSLGVKPTPRGICPTCDKLWLEYAFGTAELLKLVMEGQVAGICRDEAKSEALAKAYIHLARGRSWTRAVVHEHEDAAHEPIEVEQKRMKAGRGYLARMS